MYYLLDGINERSNYDIFLLYVGMISDDFIKIFCLDHLACVL